jgi:uncharacterized protein YciI
MTMKLMSVIGALVLAAPLTLVAQQASSKPGQAAMPPGFEVPQDMTPYFLATYVKGPKHSAAQTPESMELTKSHLRYIRRMIEEKKYMFAGPFVENGDNQGMAIVAAATAQEAKRIADGDPAVTSGHMAVRLQPVMLPSLSSLVVKY